MKITAIYDNGGRTLDRYTVMTDFRENTIEEQYTALGLNTAGDGFSQFCGAIPGRHLGRKVSFYDLDGATQAHIANRLFGEE